MCGSCVRPHGRYCGVAYLVFSEIKELEKKLKATEARMKQWEVRAAADTRAGVPVCWAGRGCGGRGATHKDRRVRRWRDVAGMDGGVTLLHGVRRVASRTAQGWTVRHCGGRAACGQAAGAGGHHRVGGGVGRA